MGCRLIVSNRRSIQVQPGIFQVQSATGTGVTATDDTVGDVKRRTAGLNRAAGKRRNVPGELRASDRDSPTKSDCSTPHSAGSGSPSIVGEDAVADIEISAATG